MKRSDAVKWVIDAADHLDSEEWLERRGGKSAYEFALELCEALTVLRRELLEPPFEPSRREEREPGDSE
jgi:hypothetical protein